ncbi:MAG: alanine--tRNA ligase [Candidatus Omnitrophota bacterium]
MTADQLRKMFLSFFESKGHSILPSDSLIPKDDPTVLFTGAGMNQFKDYFLGKRKDLRRAATCQKCLRTGDIENVGKTSSHHTFFEMLGNFSFGDYFKKEAMAWAWEFMTKFLKLEERVLWVSVYKDDDEAYRIWRDEIKVSESRILRFGAKDNFWPSNAPEEGPNGPCGPCSEIYVDRGEKFGCESPECRPGCGCGRYVEVWNLVFTQFNRVGPNQLEPLSAGNIDTGMGLERLAAVMQGVATNFETDIFAPVINGILELIENEAGLRSAKEDKQGTNRINAIADHLRAAIFCISDGVLPSNTGRGYVLKSLIKRSLVNAKSLGLNEPFLYKLVDSVVRAMKGGYPELEDRVENVSLIIKSEEERYFRISHEVRGEFEEIIRGIKLREEDAIPGKDIFYFHDTRGFSIELIKEIAEEENLKLGIEEYERLMEEQRKKSRGATKLTGDIFAETLTAAVAGSGIKTEFAGYDRLETGSIVKAIIKDNKIVHNVKGPAEISVILDITPFYGETGGQVGDTGVLQGNGFEIEVTDTKLIEKIPVHICKLREGEIKTEDRVESRVNKDRRLAIARHHSATHLLQAALRKTIGPHVQQSGSLVAPERLRFDFTHFKALDSEQLEWVEQIVNELVRSNFILTVDVMGLEEAKKSGATALFGEKYDKEVRVITIGDISKELCGGTHLKATGEIGSFKIISEESVAAGIRRIEAVAGEAAYKLIKESDKVLRAISDLLKSEPEKLPAQIEKLLNQIKDLGKKLKSYETANVRSKSKELVSEGELIDNVTLIAKRLDGLSPETLISLVDEIKAALPRNSGSVLAGSSEGKVFVVIGLTPDLVKRGFDARSIISKVSKVIGGGGGGRSDLAQAGGKDSSRIDEALKIASEAITELIKNL